MGPGLCGRRRRGEGNRYRVRVGLRPDSSRASIEFRCGWKVLHILLPLATSTTSTSE